MRQRELQHCTHNTPGAQQRSQAHHTSHPPQAPPLLLLPHPLTHTSISSAAAPATWGVAMLVPEMVFTAASDVDHADGMEVPGANRSTHDPKLEYPARLSAESEAATVMAAATNHHRVHRLRTGRAAVSSSRWVVSARKDGCREREGCGGGRGWDHGSSTHAHTHHPRPAQG